MYTYYFKFNSIQIVTLLDIVWQERVRSQSVTTRAIISATRPARNSSLAFDLTLSSLSILFLKKLTFHKKWANVRLNISYTPYP